MTSLDKLKQAVQFLKTLKAGYKKIPASSISYQRESHKGLILSDYQSEGHQTDVTRHEAVGHYIFSIP